MALTLVTVHGKYVRPVPSGGTPEPATGSLTFTLSDAMSETAVGNDVIVAPYVVTATLDGTGSFSVVLVSTDDTGVSPTGAVYHVQERIELSHRTFDIALPHGSTDVDLVTVVPVTTPELAYPYALVSYVDAHKVSGDHDSRYILLTQLGVAGGVAQLDGAGKLMIAQLPAITMNTVWPAVASQAAMLALAAEPGDVAVRSDLPANFMLAALPASTLANWVQLADVSGAGAVSSFNTRTGAVVLLKADVTGTGLAPADIGAANNTTDLTTVTQNTQTASYTFVLADAGKVVEGNAATGITFTIPPNSSVAFPVGTVIEVYQYGAGQITVAAGAGVTMNSPGALVKTSKQFASASIRKRATDEWTLEGDLA